MMRLTWQGYALLALIAYFVASSAWSAQGERTRVAELGALDACAVAHEYTLWRLAFERSLGDATRIEGAALRAFRSRSGVFERAAKAVRARTSEAPSADAQRMLDALVLLTASDASRDTASRSPEAFVDAFFDACPAQAFVAWSQ
jgi:hypothetical protein